MDYVGLFKAAKLAFNIHQIATASDRQTRKLAVEAANELAEHLEELIQQTKSLAIEEAEDDFRALTEYVTQDFLQSTAGSKVFTLLPSRFVPDQMGKQLGLVLFVAMDTMFRAGFVDWEYASEQDKFGPTIGELSQPVGMFVSANLGKPSSYAFKSGRRPRQYRDYLYNFTMMISMMSYFYGIGARRRLALVDDLPPGEWAQRKLQQLELSVL